MSATHIDELPAAVQAKILARISVDDKLSPTPVLACEMNQVADAVIQGVNDFAKVLPQIITLREYFETAERDSANRLRTPIKNCRTWTEFCRTHLGENIRTIQRLLRDANKTPKLESEPEESGSRQESIASDRDSDIQLEPCGRTDPRYVAIRDRHYIPNSGCIGRQAHFLVHFKNELVGIISGASPVYATKPRDTFFGILNQKMRNQVLNGIVNNSVFRLENTERNLATRVLRMWREVIPHYWYERYGTVVYGFETFIIETDTRVGTLYKADEWTFAGTTSGATKVRSGIDKPAEDWKSVVPKLVYCKWRKGFTTPCSASVPAWVRAIEVAQADSVDPTAWDADKKSRRKDREYLSDGGNDPVSEEAA